ncbi:NUDIX hydrolase [Streptomyces sp. NBC_01373]|uniref:NUDIX hydrolase n=1 Tax=Streptomyces sp. NBC_01373 TaxID=2903843 RepID=UPI00224FE31A|nr:NUDIX domain-containing protein [Streptomyces sp. NBC_01373]MCX4706707.1 NUDIX domain-containing protein [Streptomyces sp. NBC_01373]
MRSTPLIAGAVIAHAGRVLLIRRATPAGALLWSCPSGKVDPGETASQAAAREAHEEAGVTVAPLVVLGSRVHPVTGWPVVYVACRLLSGTARAASPREVAEVAWVPSARLREYVPGGVYAPVRAWLGARWLTDESPRFGR